MADPSMVLRTCSRLRREGKLDEALAMLRRGLVERALAPEDLDSVGRFIERACAVENGPKPDLRVLLLGQCTTSFLRTALIAVAFRHGVVLAVEDGGYDSVLQELARPRERPDAIVLLPWNQRLLAADARSADDRVEDELAFCRTAWAEVRRHGTRLVQVGYDFIGPGAFGYGQAASERSPVALVRRVNALVREELPDGAFFVDLEQVSGDMGRSGFYDPRGYHWTKQPFAWTGLERLAEHLWAAVRALTTGPKKVLVLDLDNTLWGGVVGEEGPMGVRLGDDPEGQAYRAMQAYCRGLCDRGVLLAVCSKNNRADALEPFERHPDMVLELGHFAAFEATWDAKSVMLRRIAEALRLSTDSFVFFDDNPAERAEVRASMPEVEVVEVPEDPAQYVRALEQGLYFEAHVTSTADAARAGQYRAENARRAVREKMESIDAYLASLEMVADVRPIDEADLPRVIQLIGKTNQWNLTTRRHTEADVRRLLTTPDSVALTLRLRDRFGDHGLVSVVIGVRDEVEASTLRLDTWLMSCRVIARTVEEHMLNRVVATSYGKGYRAIIGEFIPTGKNALVADVLQRFGFDRQGDAGNGAKVFRRSLEGFLPLPSFVSSSQVETPEEP